MIVDLTDCEVETLIGFIGEWLDDERNDCLENVYYKIVGDK